MTAREVTVDAAGRVRSFRYHDGVLVRCALETTPNEAGPERWSAACVAWVQALEGERTTLWMRSVAWARVADFVPGNILLTVYVRPLSEVFSRDDLRWLRDEIDAACECVDAAAEAARGRTLVRIEGSFGAQVNVICEAVEVREGFHELAALVRGGGEAP